MSSPAISLVFVLFGKRPVTERCLQSLERILGERLDEEIEVVLVDNASPDDTAELLDEWEPRATVVRHATNRNFAGGCNAGARAARGETLVFLNNDMEFVPGAVETVAATAREDGVGAAGARLLFPNGTIQHAGVIWTATPGGAPMPQHVFHHEAGDLPATRAVLDLDAVTGACLAIDRTLFLEIGGFDERYVNGLEDVDLCLRIRSRGLRVVYRGDVCLIHHESATRGVNQPEGAHNDATFVAAWGELCAPDDELARRVFGGALTARAAPPPAALEWIQATGVCVDGHLRSIAPEAAEARALLATLESAGLAPAARDRQPSWLIADLTDNEQALLGLATTRPRSPTAMTLEVPCGELYSARRRHGDVLRLASRPADPSHLAGASGVLAATPSLLDELDLPPERVLYLPPPIAALPAGPGGGGVLVLLPGDDLAACGAALTALASLRSPLRLLPSVLAPALESLAAELVPRAELLGPISSETSYAALAGTADAVVSIDSADRFDRRVLIAAGTGTAVATRQRGPAAAVLGDRLVMEPDPACAVTAALELASARESRRERVAAACAPALLAPRLAEFVARIDAAPGLSERLAA